MTWTPFLLVAVPGIAAVALLVRLAGRELARVARIKRAEMLRKLGLRERE